MMLNITFTLTLDTQYSADSGQHWGLLGKKANQLVSATGEAIIVATTIERLIDSDYRGDAVAGKRGERFVYFGLEKNGEWIRRWKLRQYHLDSIFGESSVSAVAVHVLLGKDVTPKVSINH